MKTEQLINDLTNKASAVKKVKKPAHMSLLWIAISSVYLIIMIAIFGIRDDISMKVTDIAFQIEIFLATITAIFSAYASSILSVPDSYQKEGVKWLPIIPFLLLTALLASQAIAPEIQQLNSHMSKSPFTLECAFDMLIFSIFPILIMIIYIKKAATTKSVWCASMACLAAVNLSYIALRIIEANDMAQHLLFWHYLPMLFIVFVGTLAGKKFLKW